MRDGRIQRLRKQGQIPKLVNSALALKVAQIQFAIVLIFHMIETRHGPMGLPFLWHDVLDAQLRLDLDIFIPS